MFDIVEQCLIAFIKLIVPLVGFRVLMDTFRMIMFRD